MEQRKETLKTLHEVINAFTIGIDGLLKEVADKFDGKIVKGYRSMSFQSQVASVKNGVAALNEVLPKYCTLMGLEHPSITIMEELFDLLRNSKERRIVELKVKYLKYRNISIPNVPFKIEKLAEAYDFPEEHEQLCNEIASIDPIKDTNKYRAYFNQDKKMFVFTTEHEKDILEEHTVYVTTEEMSQAMCLEMLCQALNNLKRDNNYSFKELPEIDHRLISNLSIDPLLDQVSFNLDMFNNPDGKDASIGICKDPYGGMRLFVGGKRI